MRNHAFSYSRKMLSLLLTFSIALGPVVPLYAEPNGSNEHKDNDSHEKRASKTVTPIKHVIVIVGENRSFDHLFATYVPKAGESVNNLLSEKIIKANGSPGINYSRAVQFSADITGSTTYQPS